MKENYERVMSDLEKQEKMEVEFFVGDHTNKEDEDEEEEFYEDDRLEESSSEENNYDMDNLAEMENEYKNKY